MRVRNQFSFLRLATLIFFFGAVGLGAYGFLNEQNWAMVGFLICIAALVVIRLLRFLFRD